MMLLASLGLERFRSFREKAEFKLAPLTVITGPNSSGKSSVFKALTLLQQSAQATGLARLDFAGGTHGLGSYRAALTRGEEVPMTFTLGAVPFVGSPLFRRDGIPVRSLDGKPLLLTWPLEDDDWVQAPPPTGYKPVQKTGILPRTPVFFELTYGTSEGGILLKQFRLSTGRNGEDTLCRIEVEEDELPVRAGASFAVDSDEDETLEFADEEKGPDVIGYDRIYRHRVHIHGSWLYRQFDGSRTAVDEMLGVSEAYPDDVDDLLDVLEGVVSAELVNYSQRTGALGLDDVIRDACEDWNSLYTLAGNPEIDLKEEEWFVLKLVRGFFYPILKRWITELLRLLEPTLLEHTGTLRAYPQRVFLTSPQVDGFSETLKRFATVNRTGEEAERLEGWLRAFNLGEGVRVERVADAGYTVSLLRGGEYYPLADLGYGSTQLLPLVMQTVLSERDYTSLLIEEPEASLHPNLQSKLADLFVDLSSEGNRVLVETHSEYLIRRLQYLVATGEVDRRKVVIYYLGPDPEAEDYVRRITIEESGQLSQEFGTGFTDEATNLMVDLYKYGSQN